MIVVRQLVLLQGGQPVQAQLQNGLGLGFGKPVAPVAQAEIGAQPLRAAGVGAGPLQQGLHALRRPAPGHQAGLGLGRGWRFLDQLNDGVDAGQRHRLAFQQMAALPGAPQQIEGAPGDHLPPMLHEGFQHLLEVQQARLPIHQSHAVDAEHGLQLRLGVQVVQHHLAGFAPAQLDEDAQAVLVRFVAQLGDALDALLLDQFRDLLDEPGLVQLIGNLRDENALPPALGVLAHFRPGPDIDAAPASAVGLDDAGPPVDDAGGGEIRPLDVLHQRVDADGRIVHQGQDAGRHLAQIVRRDVGGHAHGDAGTAVDQQVRRPGGQHLRHAQGVVVVGHEGDRFLVQIGQQLGGQPIHARLGVAHGRRRIPIDRAEIALAIDQAVAHGEILGHAYQGVVDGEVAMRVVLAHHLAHHAGGLDIGAVVRVVQLVHGEQHAAMHGLQAISHIRQGAADDDAHGVVQIGLAQFVLYVDGKNLPPLAGYGVGHGAGPKRTRF